MKQLQHIKKESFSEKRGRSFYWQMLTVIFFLLMSFQQTFAQFKVIGYLPTWGGNLSDVQYTKLTHINYAFLIPNSNGTVQVPDDPTRLKNLVSQAHANNVKVIISVGGGGGGDAFATIVTTSALRTAFTNNMVSFVNQYNLDGVDIDWEFPSDGTQATNFSTLMGQLSTSMHSMGKLLTAAVIAYDGTSVLNSVFPSVDFLNIMAYDENNYQHSTYALGVQSVNYWVGRGLPASKACLGVPFYGRDNCCDYKTVDYSAILAMGGSPNADTFNNEIGYNGIPTIKQKTAYAMGACAGIMIWSIDTDAIGANSLLSAINQVVVANSNPVPPNLATGKTVTVSSTEVNTTVSTAASNATDGSYNTRWGSLFADPQWITVDLGANFNVNRVKLSWEAAYATAYQIQISSDNVNWTTLKSVTGNTTTTNDQTGLTGTGRYVRIYGTSRATVYGYSLYEIEVYGTAIESPYTGTAINLPGKIEAENYDLGGEGLAYHDIDAVNQGGAYRTADGVDIQATTDTGAGYNVGYIAAGEWLKYMVNVTAAGNYDIAVRVAATAAGSTLHIELDGANVTGTITVPNTGAWQTWQTVTIKNVALTAGAKTMKVSMDGGSFNLNYITVQSSVVVVNQAPSVSLTAPANGATAIAPATIVLTASASDVDGTVSKVDFYNGTTLLGTSTASPYSFTWSNVAAGSYTITAKATDNSGAVTTSAAATVTVTTPVVVNDCPKLTWSDEFNGTSLDQTKWNYQTGDGCPGNCGWGNNELEYYTSSTNNVSVSGGSLALTARYEPNYNGSGKNYTSGKLVTSGKFSQKYGRYEARIKAPSAASIWPAFWMLADNTNWPATGEIDILECLNAKPTLWYGTLHYASTAGVHQSKGATWTSPAPLSDDYHVYAVEWSTTQISWFIDGTLRGTATKADVISGGGVWPFDDQNFFIILNVAVGGNFPGQTPVSSQFPVSMLVDYVRVYSGDPCTVTEAPYGGTAWPIPGTIEAENYDVGGEGVSYHDATATNDGGAYRQDGVDIEASTDTGGGYDVGYTAAGEWLKYTANVTVTGNYDLGVRLAATAAGKSLHVEEDGVNISGAIAVPNTGGWQTWQTVTVKNIPLTAGQHILRIVMDTDGFNLNKIVFTPSSTTQPVNQPPTVSLTAPANNASQNAPASIAITANASDADGTVSKVDFYNGTTLLGTDATSPYAYTWTNVTAGTYSITAKATDNSGATTTSTAVTVKVNTVVASNSCTGIATYVENGGYVAGSKVQSDGSQYQCKPYPYSGWCNGAAWAYGPGSGSYWTDAWTLVGSCSSAARSENISVVNDAMLNNAPNPFNGMTNVQVTVQEAGDVSLQVFDKTGLVVATLFEGYLSAGTYDYTLDATHLKADLYIVKFNSNSGVITRKIMKAE